MDDKRELIYNSLFDVFKIIFGYEIVFLGATILQTASGIISFTVGVFLIVSDVSVMILTVWVFSALLYDIYKKIKI